MAPGLLSELPSVEDARQGIETITINLASKKEDETPVNGEKVVNGESHEADAPPNGQSGEPPEVVEVLARDGDEDSDSDSDSDSESEIEDETVKCEIKLLDRRFDEDDEIYYGERKTETATTKPKKKDWWKLFTLCLVRNYDSDDEQEESSLHVHPPFLRQLLFDVIAHFPGSPIMNLNAVEIQAPYHSLFYHRKELETEGLKRFAEDDESLAHLHLLLNWIKTHFELDIAAYESCTTQKHKAIAYDKVWTLFPPGTIAYATILSQNRAFRVVSSFYDTSELAPNLTIQADFIDFNGQRLGNRRIELNIVKYPGTRDLNESEVIPLDLLDDAADLREEFLTRGRRFESYIGQHFLQYNGLAIKKTPNGYDRFTVIGRVMIDCKTYLRLEPNEGFVVGSVDSTMKLERSRKRAKENLNFVEAGGAPKFDKLSDEEAMLTNATVRGYSFTMKRFLEFFVEDLSDIEWNSGCFDDLVLDPAIKKTVQALVTTHSQKRESFDDIVKGKGMGLVCVLHGPPGVGKTLTAECVAELVKRPLFMVSSGDRKFHSSSPSLDRTRANPSQWEPTAWTWTAASDASWT